MPVRQFRKPIARVSAVPSSGRARRLAVIACLALLLLAPAAAKASDWMPQIEDEATTSPAKRQPARQAPEPDPLAPLVEKPDYAPQKAAGPSSGQTMRMPVLVAYSALNRDLAALAGKKPLALKTGCDALALKSPKIGPGGGPGLVTLKCPANFISGVVREGSCRTLKKWSGTMAAAYRVGYDQPGGRLVFTPKSLALRDARGRNAPPEIVRGVRKFAGLISRKLLGRLSLQKHVRPPGGMASGLFEDAGGWLSDLDRPEGWRIRGVEAVRAGLEVSLETQAKATAQQADRPLSDKELLGLWSGWESWDDYLVGVCRTVGKTKLNRDQQDKLLFALLDNRYAMAGSRGQKELAPARVRSKIESSWDEIKPVVAQVAASSAEAEAGSLTRIMAAGDTLTGALNRDAGLAAKINPRGINQLFGPQTKAKKRAGGSDDFLRDALGLAPEAKEEDWDFADEPPEVDDWPVPSISEKPKKGRKKPAPKKTPVPGAPVTRSEWVPDLKNPKAYVAKVRKLMAQTADEVLKKGGPAAKYRDLFQEMTAATAWQESCWIHYVRKKDGRIAILGSYDNKSAGIMQINFQVWKGIYNTDLLRKSIRYNAKAGCEILKLYMERYALRKMDKRNPPPPDLLARSVYSMYNGGPRQFAGFFRRLKNNQLWKSEKLWNQKFQRVRAGQWDKIRGCMPATARWAD